MQSSDYASLEVSEDAGDLVRHHQHVVTYYDSYNSARETHFDFLRGKQWSAEELEVFRRKNKAPAVFNTIKTAERTVLGLMIQNKYDVKYAPTEPTDQGVSSVLQQLYAHISYGQEWAFRDIEVFRQAYAGGSGYQELYIRVQPGKEPALCTRNQNSFAVFFDPDSRDLILREDAEFVDRETWLPWEELVSLFPEVLMDEEFDSRQRLTDDTGFETVNVYKDRSHQHFDKKNGRLKVIERFYKVRRKVFYTLDNEYRRMDIEKKDFRAFKEAYPELPIYSDEEEMLHLAVVAPAWHNAKYLYNGEYHCQPRDPSSRRIIFPILEMVAESLNGEPSGFVEHMVGPQKSVNSIMSNILHSAKHAASSSYLRRAGALKDEAEEKLFDKYHSDGDRTFTAKSNVPSLADVVSPIPKGDVNADNHHGLEFAMQHLQDVSSTPPAIKGMADEKGVSGILNAQRIEQSFIQLQILTANWKMFLKRRATLLLYYIQKYWTYEKTFRIVEKKDPQDPDFLTINQQVPEMDPNGNLTGAIQKINDVSEEVGRYDVAIEDSYQSPTYRFKTQQQISELMQAPAVQSDPSLMGMLLVEYSRLSDMSQDLKDFVKQHSMAMQQAQAQQMQMQMQQQQMEMQGQELDQQGKLQGIAQAEAEQTAMPTPEQPVPGAGESVQRSLQQRPTAYAPQEQNAF